MIGHFFIDRPKFAIVISIVIIIAGLIALLVLPISLYPKIAPPTVVVSTSYPGANAETVQKSVIMPLENAINGVPDMLYMSSTSFNDGTATITVTFDIGTNGEDAAVNVQNRVYGVYSQLPEEIQRQGVDVSEKSTDMLCVIALYSPDETYDNIFLNNYADINLKNPLARISGIGSITVFGNKDYSMRIWMDSDKLTALKLSTTDIVNAIKAQNVQVASGQIGAEPSPKNQQFLYTIETKGMLSTVKDFDNIIIRTKPDGSTVKLKDVAKVELGSENYNSTATLDGKHPAALLIINQLPGANALEVIKQIKNELKESSKIFPKDLDVSMYYDNTKYITASIHEVAKTLIIAVILVIFIVYLFLQNWRATLIPAITIPVSLIGTLALLLAIGYTINIITLFGLILAIGIVVDDSILEIENDNRLMVDEGLSPKEAAKKTVTQVTAPVIATTCVLMAVFVPIAFFPGLTGELYRQFSITIVAAVWISTLNALTLSPALCSSILKRPNSKTKFIGFVYFNRVFEWMTAKYGKIVAFFIRKISIVGILFLVIIAVMLVSYKAVPSGFIPLEDQGKFMINVQLPSGTSLKKTQKITDRISQILSSTNGVTHFMTMDGYNGLNKSYSSNSAFVIVVLKDWKDREGKDLFEYAIINRLKSELDGIRGAKITPFVPPSIPGLGTSNGFEMVIQDRNNGSPIQIGIVADNLIKEAKANPEIGQAFTTYRTDVPQLYIDINREKVEKLGVDITDVFNTLRDNLGSKYVNDFNKYGNIYKVIIQAQMDFRSKISDIGRLNVRSSTGKMIPLSTLIQVKKKVGPNMISRYDMFQSVSIMGVAAQGYSSGEGIAAMEKIAKKVLPDGYTYEWTGMSYQEKLAGNNVFLIFLASVIFIYLFMVAQYESWTIVLAVMMAIPIAVLGAMLSLLGMSIFIPLIDNNIYAQVGIVLIFGLSTKTAILIVEFAKKNREEGQSILKSAESASKLRFRAVIMTAVSFILGTFPLVIATGAGAMSMKSIGIIVFGGMIFSIFLGTILIPAFYVMMQKLSE
ncbi:MAG: multidrug efflux RND transporter permease subunit, partial [bacterium]|nr:multidrug efflux RND transporter permease subunit [bacterium]